MVEEIVALALESRVRLLLDLELHVTRLHARHLITLASEVDLRPALHALVNVHVQDLPLDDRLLAVALLALVLLPDALTLAVAIRTHGLESLDHGTHLAHHGLHTLAIAALACLHRTILASAPITLGANDALLQCELRDLAAVDVF